VADEGLGREHHLGEEREVGETLPDDEYRSAVGPSHRLGNAGPEQTGLAEKGPDLEGSGAGDLLVAPDGPEVSLAELADAVRELAMGVLEVGVDHAGSLKPAPGAVKANIRSSPYVGPAALDDI